MVSFDERQERLGLTYDIRETGLILLSFWAFLIFSREFRETYVNSCDRAFGRGVDDMEMGSSSQSTSQENNGQVGQGKGQDDSRSTISSGDESTMYPSSVADDESQVGLAPGNLRNPPKIYHS